MHAVKPHAERNLTARPVSSCRIGIVLTLFWVASTALAGATTWFVAADGTGDFPTVQAAITAASGGDIIELGDGLFTG
ncbi:MAG: hypothetical protein GF355_14125, partial [Candidatus Eisenbacteria bacterium]|nr:hypothetical protein [Candidatus Eisenbacteria bacterium]